jgi:hypothetical protein
MISRGSLLRAILVAANIGANTTIGHVADARGLC